MFRRSLPAAVLACLLALAGCGGGSHTSSHHVVTTTSKRTATSPVPAPPVAPAAGRGCPPGESFMGCSFVPRAGATPGPVGAVPRGRLISDVSSWQGHPNWAEAKPHIAGGIAKAFEYGQDPDFVYNVDALKKLGLPWGAYDFVRSCNAAGFIAALRTVGGPSSLPPIIDMEVPAAAGCAPSLDRQIYTAFHRHAVIYTAPGTWPGGSNAALDLWEATYGPSYSPVWHPVVAWQFTDGVWGNTVSIPGIGTGDVSVDYGLLEQIPAKPKPDPFAVYCPGPFPSRFGPLNERLVAEEAAGAEQHPQKYAAYLRNALAPRLLFLADRIAYVALVEHKGWGGQKGHERGPRFQLLSKAAQKAAS